MFSVTLVLAMVCIGSFTVDSRWTNKNPYYNRHSSRPTNYYNGYSPSTVGFTVSKTADQRFSSNGIITFDEVVTNVGKAFRASDSKVVIPTTGLYYFSFSIRTNTATVETIDLVKNGEKVISAMGFTAANSAVVFAKRGDQLYLRAVANSVILGAKTSFAGFLIKTGYFGY